ncbi:MAG: hypothetical protein ACRC2S_27170 [Waterburya sp.]
MNIIMVKKIKLDGNLCRKSAAVSEKLENLNLSDRINAIVFADERELLSQGFELARRHDVQAAPFFIVEQENSTQVYTKYSHFLAEVLGHNISETEEIAEIMAQHPDLDFI